LECVINWTKARLRETNKVPQRADLIKWGQALSSSIAWSRMTARCAWLRFAQL
jgi:hypothetical protein